VGTSIEPVVQVVHETVGDAHVVRVAGEIDMVTAPDLRAELERACTRARPSQRVVLDLAAVSFLGSAGLSVLLEIDERCRDRRTPLWIVATTRATVRPLEITGLDGVLHLVDSLDDAVRST
jgi:anti-sigma B factor antagonist